MRLSRVFELLETADQNKIYVIGDSHARAIGAAIPGSENLAQNGATVSSTGAQAAAVPNNTSVVLSVGNNNVGDQAVATASAAVQLVRELKRKGCHVYFVLFPMINLQGPFAETYAAAGYTENYNRVRETLRRQVSSHAQTVIMLNTADINPSDPQKIHATNSAYSRVAAQVSRQAATHNLDVRSAEDPNEQLDTSGISEQDVALLDRDGDGVVTRGDYNHAMSYGQGEDLGSLSAISAGEGIAGLFGLLSDLMAQMERGQPSVNELRTAADRVRERQSVDDTEIDTSGLGRTGELRTGGAAERSLAQYARSRWRNRNNTELWIAQLCAQCAAETDDFRLIEEQGGRSYFQRYEGRRDLGNTQPGDGARYKGRGWIQLTGRDNYTRASRALGVDLVNNPEQAATPDIANRTAVWYFETRVMNRVTDPTDIRTITRLINGGYNGWNRRVAEFNERLDALRSTTRTAGEPGTGASST